MKIISTHKRTIYGGDIHGEFKTLIYELKRLKITDALVIILGDISLGFYKPGYYIQMFNYMQKQLEKINNTIVFFRGNHDNPLFFEKDMIGKTYDNILIASDYTIIEQNNNKSLIVGGAISIDRSIRKKDKTYWINEDIKYNDDLFNSIKNENITTILTHTSPIHVWPSTKDSLSYWLKYDNNLSVDEYNSRNKLQQLLNNLLKNNNNITNWYYGHFHKNNLDIYKNIKFRCIENNKLYEEK